MSEEMHETTMAVAVDDDRPKDEAGRVFIAHLSDREVAEETLAHLRSVADAIAELSDTPMMKAMRGGGNPLMAMMRG
jgi:hypothetical protein